MKGIASCGRGVCVCTWFGVEKEWMVVSIHMSHGQGLEWRMNVVEWLGVQGCDWDEGE